MCTSLHLLRHFTLSLSRKKYHFNLSQKAENRYIIFSRTKFILIHSPFKQVSSTYRRGMIWTVIMDARLAYHVIFC